jgi:predicted AlkP superfamily pyrophosphatase or phosphodiesterase
VRSAGAVCLAGLLASSLTAEAARTRDRPTLVVLIVIDQLASHYLRRWGDLTTEGIGRLARRGAYYRRGVFSYSNTETAPGHATIATGAWPSTHGLVANNWYTAGGAKVYCVDDKQYGKSPANLMAPGIADAIELATRGASKTISIATKDRAAITLGGSRPDLAAWYDEDAGRFITGTWEGVPRAPEWFNERSLHLAAAGAFGQSWDRFRPRLDYERVAGRDDLKHEAKLRGLGRTFPRKLGQGLSSGTDLEWRKIWPASPPAVDAVVELALAALEKESLGSRGTVDYLALSFATLDYAGHFWGSGAQETLDLLLRIDAALGRLIDAVEKRVGSGGALFVLTGDHGAMPTPEEDRGIRQRRLSPDPIISAVNGLLKREFPKEDVSLIGINSPRIYLGPTRAGSDRSKINRRVAEVLRGVPGIVDAVAFDDLDRWASPMREHYQRSSFPGRNADVLLLHAAHDLIDTTDVEYQGVGTSHGSPYGYDTTVPIIVFGPGVRGSVDELPYRMTKVAPTIAALLEIEPPAAAVDEPLPAVR